MSPQTTSNQTCEEAGARAAKFLLSARNDHEGWFPYVPGGDCSLEATAWALLALASSNRHISDSGLDYLAANQNKSDGGWSTRPGAGRSDWTSGPVLLCLRLLSASSGEQTPATISAAINRGMSYLLDSRVEFFGPTARLLLLISRGAEGLAYARGWPWDPKCFHWIEPTSYCLMALKLPQAPAKEIHRTVIKFADKFITEHACQGGGWNHGNDLTLGSYLPPYRMTTAEALLALQDDRANKVIEPALTYLKGQAKEDCSSLTLALSILALGVYDQPFEQELSFLLKRQAEDGSFGPSLMSTALACLALQTAGGTKMLKIKDTLGREASNSGR
jgi:hypothetical protein